MEMTYALILVVALKHSFVIDHSLTYEDCMTIQSEWAATLDEHAYVTCELEPK